MGGYGYRLRGEFFRGSRGGWRSVCHGSGHAGDWDALVFESVDGGVGKLAHGAAAGAGDGIGGVADAAVGVFDSFVFGFIDRLEGVVQSLSFADLGVG